MRVARRANDRSVQRELGRSDPANGGSSRAAAAQPLSPVHLLDRAQRLGHRPDRLGLSTETDAVQRKSGTLVQSGAMTADAPTGTTVFSGTHTYEDVVGAVAAYHDNGRTPAADYGRQLVQLDEIRRQIGLWEAKYGLVTAPIPDRTFGAKTVDKRRRVLNTLSGGVTLEVTAVRAQGLVAATAAHQADRAALLAHVQLRVHSPELLLANSAEWVLSGRTRFYAVTPTGDSYARLVANANDPVRDEVFFPAARTGTPGHVADPNAATYDATNLANNAGLTTRVGGKAVGGWQDDQAVAVTRAAAAAPQDLDVALRHEVQHDADKNKGRDTLAGVRQAGEDYAAAPPGGLAAQTAVAAARAEVLLQKYKTEYRAYSVQEGAAGGTYTNLDDAVQNQVQDGHQVSARQRAILRHILAGYPAIRGGWNANGLLADGATRFQDAVVAYWRPATEGFNPLNSIRIDAFYQALDALGTKAVRTGLEVGLGADAAPVTARVTNAAAPGVLALIATIQNLTADDVDAILYRTPAMLRKIDAHLGGAARTAVHDELREVSNMHAMAGLFG